MVRPNGKNILVTGGTGFIGSHLVEELVRQKAHVVVPYLQMNRATPLMRGIYKKEVRFVPLNIKNKGKIRELIASNNIDYIFHLAAQTLVTEAYKNPYETIFTNIVGTVNILEAMRELKTVKGLLFASSDKAYGKTKQAYTEESPLKGDHPYDVSKSSADLIVQAYYKTYKLPVVIARFGNVYGEGDLHFDRLIPGLCKAVIEKKTFLVRSDGTYVRDYIYVKDVVDGYLALFNQMKNIQGESYNFSSSDTLSVLEIIKKAEKVLKRKISYKTLNIAKNEIPYQHLEDVKIRKLNWKNSYDLVTTLDGVIDWYRKIL